MTFKRIFLIGMASICLILNAQASWRQLLTTATWTAGMHLAINVANAATTTKSKGLANEESWYKEAAITSKTKKTIETIYTRCRKNPPAQIIVSKKPDAASSIILPETFSIYNNNLLTLPEASRNALEDPKNTPLTALEVLTIIELQAKQQNDSTFSFERCVQPLLMAPLVGNAVGLHKTFGKRFTLIVEFVGGKRPYTFKMSLIGLILGYYLTDFSIKFVSAFRKLIPIIQLSSIDADTTIRALEKQGLPHDIAMANFIKKLQEKRQR